MGKFKKHLDIAKEKLKAVAAAYKSKQRTVVGDLGTKVVEQLVEADAARVNEHYGTHSERHKYSNKNFPAVKEMLSEAGGVDISGDVYNRVISIQRKLKLISIIGEKLSSFKKKLKQKFYSTR